MSYIYEMGKAINKKIGFVRDDDVNLSEYGKLKRKVNYSVPNSFI